MWWLFAIRNFYDTLSAIHSRQRPPQRSNKCFLSGGIVRQKIASAQRKRNIHKEYCDFSHCRCSSRGNGKGYVPSSIAQKHPNDPFILKCSVKAVWSVLTSSLCVGAIFFCPVIKFWNYCFVRFFIMLSTKANVTYFPRRSVKIEWYVIFGFLSGEPNMTMWDILSKRLVKRPHSCVVIMRA